MIRPTGDQIRQLAGYRPPRRDRRTRRRQGDCPPEMQRQCLRRHARRRRGRGRRCDVDRRSLRWGRRARRTARRQRPLPGPVQPGEECQVPRWATPIPVRRRHGRSLERLNGRPRSAHCRTRPPPANLRLRTRRRHLRRRRARRLPLRPRPLPPRHRHRPRTRTVDSAAKRSADTDWCGGVDAPRGRNNRHCQDDEGDS